MTGLGLSISANFPCSILLTQEEVDTFLKPYVPKFAYLDPERPMSLGNFADPEYYTEARHDMQVAMDKSMEVIKEVGAEFGEKFGRTYGLTEPYLCEDAEIILVCMGSMASTVRYVVDQLREKGEKVGLLKIRAYRPFPYEEIDEIVKNADKLAVLDKNFSFGIGGALFADLKTKCHKETYGFILGLGGRDVIPEYIEEAVELTKNPVKEVTWLGLKEDE